MKISKRAKRLIGQGMFQIKVQAEALERKGKHLIHFEIGDSYFNAPKKVKDSCIKAIRENKTHYVNPKGLSKLRKAIAKRYKVEIENVVVVPANFGIFAILSILCNKGDKIKYPIPGFPTYKAVANYLGLKYSDKAKIKISNSPNNPTGKIEKINGWTIFDETYKEIIYNKLKNNNNYLKNIIRIYSFSKSHAMSGFRLGYMIAPKEIIDKVGLLIETTYSCLPEFIQYAGLKSIKIKGYKLKELRKRRDLMVKLINQNKRLYCEVPDGGIYCWARIDEGYSSSKLFFEECLEKGVVVCPGEVFGKEGYIRFCFANSIENIKKGFKKLES